MPYIEMAVPLDISASEPLVAARTLPAEKRPESYLLLFEHEQTALGQMLTPGEVTLGANASYLKEFATHPGTSMIKIHGSRPLRPQVKYTLC